MGGSMKKVYAGTSGWAYTTWKPDFYPASLSSTKFLNYYASRLNSVEVNYTFRSLPTKKLLKDWIAATSPGFKFAVKAHQLCGDENYVATPLETQCFRTVLDFVGHII